MSEILEHLQNLGLLENTTALPLSAAQLAMLNDAAATDWSAVEPSMFGTLLTRALCPRAPQTRSRIHARGHRQG